MREAQSLSPRTIVTRTIDILQNRGSCRKWMVHSSRLTRLHKSYDGLHKGGSPVEMFSVKAEQDESAEVITVNDGNSNCTFCVTDACEWFDEALRHSHCMHQDSLHNKVLPQTVPYCGKVWAACHSGDAARVVQQEGGRVWNGAIGLP